MQKWLETFLTEKNLLDATILVEGSLGENSIPVQCLVDQIVAAPAHEQAQIKDVLVKIDFHNGDVMDFLTHISKAIAL